MKIIKIDPHLLKNNNPTLQSNNLNQNYNLLNKI